MAEYLSSPTRQRLEARNEMPGMMYAQGGGTNNFGLDPNLISKKVTPGISNPGYAGVGGIVPGYQVTQPKTTYTYNGPGGEFSRGETGGWTGAGGERISDLPGYLEMRQRRAEGANFGDYQNQLNQLAPDYKQYQERLNETLGGQTGAEEYKSRLDELLANPSYAQYQSQLNELLNNPNAIEQSPAYQFRLAQGNQAINRSAAAKGMLNSGNVLAELAKYGQGMASQEYENQFNRLAGLTQSEQANYGNMVNQLGGLMQGQQANYGNRVNQLANILGQQQGFYGSEADRIANLIRNAQQFGISSGYYQNPQLGAAPGGTPANYQPSTW